MGLITSAGVGSGINVEAIIEAILNAERAPKESSLLRNERRVESTLSALGKLSSSIDKLQTSLDSLNSISDFRIFSASSSDTDFLTATANSETSAGSFSIIIDSLAQGSRLESTAGVFADVTDTVGSGTLTFTAGSETFDVTIGASDTLETIRDNINSAASNFGVSVNIVNSASGPVLSISSSISGSGNTLAITNDNASLDSISTSLTTEQSSSGAAAQINGLAVTSDTNVFKDAIQDLSFTAVKVTVVGEPITLDIEVDKSSIKDLITEFVDAINEFQSLTQSLSQSSADTTGALSGDVTLRLLSQSIVSTLQDTVSGLSSNFNSLNSIGVTFDDLGKLQVDEDALDLVIESNFDDIADVFASANGVSLKLQTITSNFTGSGSLIEIREQSLENQKRRLENDRLNFDFRIEQLEAQLRRKFGAMDALVASLNSTGAFLTQQLANLPGFGDN